MGKKMVVGPLFIYNHDHVCLNNSHGSYKKWIGNEMLKFNEKCSQVKKQELSE